MKELHISFNYGGYKSSELGVKPQTCKQKVADKKHPLKQDIYVQTPVFEIDRFQESTANTSALR